MVSTRDLTLLPDIDALRERLQQFAVLAEIFSVEYDTPPFEFHPHWSAGEQMGADKSGCGDELHVHFTPAGCFIKGFARGSKMNPYRTDPPKLWPGLMSSVPKEFASSLAEPAFEIPATTFVVWRRRSDAAWRTDDLELPEGGDGSEKMLGRLLRTANEFADWLHENFEVEVNREIVADVFRGRPLTEDQLQALNPSAKLSDLRRVVGETGYAMA